MGAAAFPYMVDPNSKISMGESDDIINYLYETYGEGAKVRRPFSPLPGNLSPVFVPSHGFLLRGRSFSFLDEKATDTLAFPRVKM